MKLFTLDTIKRSKELVLYTGVDPCDVPLAIDSCFFQSTVNVENAIVKWTAEDRLELITLDDDDEEQWENYCDITIGVVVPKCISCYLFLNEDWKKENKSCLGTYDFYVLPRGVHLFYAYNKQLIVDHNLVLLRDDPKDVSSKRYVSQEGNDYDSCSFLCGCSAQKRKPFRSCFDSIFEFHCRFCGRDIL